MDLHETMSWIPYIVGGVALVLALAGYKLWLRLFGVIIISKTQLGKVNKKWVLFGENKRLPDGKIIALHGEAGWQADTLAPGLHFGYWPWQYEVALEDFSIVKQGFVGVVDAKDGIPLSGGRVLGKSVACDAFQNARAFLEGGGNRGSQIAIIPQGAYRINKALFEVVERPVREIADDKIGLVTTKEGTSLPTGEIAGPEIPGHNMFQDAQSFVNNGGFKGPQTQVMLPGRYFINPQFATVEDVPLTEVAMAHVGAVISYVGEPGEDVTGEGFKHGNLVAKGKKGVWVEPVDPGRYPINPRTHRVETVPTANIVLNWATGKTESHKLDEHLSTIKVRSSDGFDYTMDVSQIIHIPRNEAPKVIARFGTVANLVTQVLEPTIGNYFRNAAQNSDVIDFLTKRSERQEEAKTAIAKVLVEYGVVAVDTLIGDIVPPRELMKTLTDRKIAQQEEVTFGNQEKAQDARKKFAQAQAMADTQPQVVTAERTVAIAEFTANAAVAAAKGTAQAKTINAEADAMVTKVTGDADASKILAIGTAEADVIKMKIQSIEPDNYAAIEVSRNFANSKVPIVPGINVGGGQDGKSGGTLVDVLIANLLAANVNGNNSHASDPAPAGGGMGDAGHTEK